MNTKLCECGCGQAAPISPKTERARGYVKGVSRRFIHGHNGRVDDPDLSRHHPEDRGYATPCWIWDGRRDAHGYGKVDIGGSNRPAHRFIYERIHGPIAAGHEPDHLCRVRCCVNPGHIEAVTKRENILRGVSPAAVNARKTHCDQGHAFTPENTYVYPGGHRRCIECRTAYNAVRRERYAA